ncbi:hypothetical protein B9Z55_020981 [Caenorhabditis nigoni]|uniref:Uncharacterized protein n=1 Tax=Caenorhabditis nigoni TaxID=1611254 RepID=A0A2G5TQ00_9PELO|nr:hypothetical protein B9Z55_020981 [Caenorhabditis nigoni]
MSGISEVGKFQHPIKLIAIVLLWFFSLYTAFHVIKNFEKTSIAETSRPALFEEKTVIQMDTDSPDITQRKLNIPVQLETQTPVKHKGVCRSPECIQLAHQLVTLRIPSKYPEFSAQLARYFSGSVPRFL